MSKWPLAVGLAVVLAGTSARAQEQEQAPPDDEALVDEGSPAEEDVAPPVRHKIRVLRDPYDIASFYRSQQGSSLFGYDARSERYPIASYYRNHQVSPYAGYGDASGYGGMGFWQDGYTNPRGGLGVGFRRSIGQNGELFLFAPAFLAPLGPLTGFVLFGP
jgi:hypothetical protein